MKPFARIKFAISLALAAGRGRVATKNTKDTKKGR